MTPETDLHGALVEVVETMQGLAEAVRELKGAAKREDPADWMGAAEVSKRLGIPRSFVLEICHKTPKLFKAFKRGSRWLIHWESAHRADLSEWRP